MRLALSRRSRRDCDAAEAAPLCLISRRIIRLLGGRHLRRGLKPKATAVIWPAVKLTVRVSSWGWLLRTTWARMT